MLSENSGMLVCNPFGVKLFSIYHSIVGFCTVYTRDVFVWSGSIIVGSLQRIFEKEGIRGMYRGLAPTVLALLPNWAVCHVVQVSLIYISSYPLIMVLFKLILVINKIDIFYSSILEKQL